MNPVHYQFVTKSPGLVQYSIERLFAILDEFDERHRHQILMAAYRCFDLERPSGYLSCTNHKQVMYQDFRNAFARASRAISTDDEDQHSRDGYAVYGLVSYLLVESLSDAAGDVYGTFRFRNQEDIRNCEKAIKGDELARELASQWGPKAFGTLERVYFSKVQRRIAYRRFCEDVVEPLLSAQEDADSQPTRRIDPEAETLGD